MYNILDLNKKELSELQQIALEFKIDASKASEKRDLIYQILDAQAINGAQKKGSDDAGKTDKPQRQRINKKGATSKVYSADQDKENKIKEPTQTESGPTEQPLKAEEIEPLKAIAAVKELLQQDKQAKEPKKKEDTQQNTAKKKPTKKGEATKLEEQNKPANEDMALQSDESTIQGKNQEAATDQNPIVVSKKRGRKSKNEKETDVNTEMRASPTTIRWAMPKRSATGRGQGRHTHSST